MSCNVPKIQLLHHQTLVMECQNYASSHKRPRLLYKFPPLSVVFNSGMTIFPNTGGDGLVVHILFTVFSATVTLLTATLCCEWF